MADDFYPDDETVDEPASVTPEVTSSAPVQVASADEAPPWLDYAPAAKQPAPAPAARAPAAPAASAPATPKSQEETPPWLDYAPAAQPTRAPAPTGGFVSNFERGLTRGAIGGNAADIASTSQGMAEIFGGDAPQWTKDLEKWGQSFQEGSLAPDTQTWSEAYQKGNLWGHLGGVIGETIGGVAPVVAGGWAGTVAGGAAGTAAEPGGGTVAGGFLGMGAGALAGMSLPAFVQGYGSSYRGLRDDPGVKAKVEDGQLTDQDVARIAVVPGLISTALNVIPVGKITGIGAISKEAVDEAVKNSIVKVLAKDTAGMTLAGFSTAVVNETAQALTGGDTDAANRVSRVLDQTVTAAVTGLGLGTVTIGAEKVRGGEKPAAEPPAVPKNDVDPAVSAAINAREPAPSGAGTQATGEADAGVEQPGGAETAPPTGSGSAASPGAPDVAAGGAAEKPKIETVSETGGDTAQTAALTDQLDRGLDRVTGQGRPPGQQAAQPAQPANISAQDRWQRVLDEANARQAQRLQAQAANPEHVNIGQQPSPAAGSARPEEAPAAPPVGVAPEPPLPATPEPQTLHMTPEDAELVRRASELTDAFKLTDNGDGSHTLEHPSLTPGVNGQVTAHAEPTGQATTPVEVTRRPDGAYALSRAREPLAELGQKQKQQKVKTPEFTPARQAFVERARQAQETHGDEVNPFFRHVLAQDELTRTGATPEARQAAENELRRLYYDHAVHGPVDERRPSVAETPSKPGHKGEQYKAKARAEAKDARSIADKAKENFVISVRDALEERGVERSRAEKIARDEADKHITEFSASKETDPRKIADALLPSQKFLDDYAGRKKGEAPQPAASGGGKGGAPAAAPSREPPKGMGPKAKFVWSKFKTAVLDRHHPLEKFQQWLGPVAQKLDPHGAMRLLEARTAAAVREHARLYWDPVDRIIKSNKLTDEEVGRYLTAKHAEERNRHIEINIDPRNPSGSGMSTVEARRILADAAKDPKKRAALENISELAQKGRKADLDRRQAAGLLTAQDRANLPKFSHYVPLSGFEEKLDDHGDSGMAHDLQVVGSEVRKVEGRKTAAANPLENLRRQAVQGIRRAEENRVVSTLGEAVRATVKDPWDKTNVARDVGELSQTGKNTLGEALADPRIVGYKRDGKQRFLVFKDGETAKAIMALRQLDMIAPLRAVLRFENRLKTLWTHLSPDFLARHFLVRYPWEGAVNLSRLRAFGVTPNRAKYFKDAVARIPDIRRVFMGGEPTGKDAALIKEFFRAGGALDFRGMRDTFNMMEHFGERLKQPENLWQSAGAKIKAVDDYLGAATSAADASIRFAVYRQAREGGLSEKQAALLAHDSTVDFTRRGAMSNYIGLFVPFGNVAIQTASIFGRNLKTPAFQRTIGVMMATAAAAAASNYYFGGKDKDGTPYFDKIPEFDRRKNLIILVPGKPGEDPYTFKLPLPYPLMPVMAAGYGLATLIAGAMGQTKKTWGDVGTDVAKATTEGLTPFASAADTGNLISVVTPEAARPFVENWGNKDFAGKDIVKTKPGDRRPPSEQSMPTGKSENIDWLERTGVNLAAPWLSTLSGGKLDYNPAELKHVLDAYLGTQLRFFGGEVPSAIKQGRSWAAGDKDHPFDASELPIAKVFGGENWGFADYLMKQDALKGAPPTYTWKDRYTVVNQIGKAINEGDLKTARGLFHDFNTQAAKPGSKLKPITDKDIQGGRAQSTQWDVIKRAVEARNAGRYSEAQKLVGDYNSQPGVKKIDNDAILKEIEYQKSH